MPHASTAAYDRVWLADSPTVTAEYSWPLDEGHTEGKGRLSVATGPNVTLQNGHSTPAATAATSIPRPIASSSPAAIVELSSSPAAMFLSAFSPPCTDIPLEESTSAEDKEGDVIGGYVLGRVIGHGGNSIVRRASSLNGGNAVAVKIVRLGAQTRKARRELEKEEEIWSSLSHENVLPLFSSYHTATATFFITPLCETGSLFDVLDRERQHHAGRQASGLLGLPPSEASPLFRQVISGLRYLHEQAGLVHRDMKLENVLVDEMGNCRISDFGTAKRIGVVEEEDSDDEDDAFGPIPIQRAISVSSSAPRLIPARHRNSTTAAHPRSASAFHNIPKPVQRFQPGSLPYASPELLSTTPQPVGFAQDIWAIGVMLYALVVGQLPFVDGFEPRLSMKIRHAEIPYPESLPSGTLRVLKGCLDRNVNSRWTVAQLDDEAWAVGGDVEPSSASMFVDPEVLAHDIGHNGAKEGRDRRSKSRARRSASRGPLTIGLGYSFTHPISHPTTPHTGTPTSGYSYQRLARSRQSSDNSHSPPSSASTSLSTSRGRERVKPDVYSRSASPSMAPATPIDELEVAVALERRGRRPRVNSSYEDFDLALRGDGIDTEIKTPV